MRGLEIQLFPYKSKGGGDQTFLLKALDEKDGINETLDDQIVNT